MRRIRYWFIAALIVLLGATFVFAYRPYRTCANLAVREYFSPTQILVMPPPRGCVPTATPAPATLLKIVDYQKSFYRLELQNVTVCRTDHVLPQGEPGFTDTAFDAEAGKRWLPLYVGCCSYQFKRHVTVVASQPDGKGSLVVIAALVQSRWRYLHFLRSHCDDKLQDWL